MQRGLSSIILKIGGVLFLAFGVADILRGLLVTIVFSCFGWLLSDAVIRFHPGLIFLGRILTLLGPTIGVARLLVGVAAALVGYKVVKLAVPQPTPTRDLWLTITTVLTAIAFVFLSPWYVIAFVVTLAGLLISPTLQASTLPASSQPN